MKPAIPASTTCGMIVRLAQRASLAALVALLAIGCEQDASISARDRHVSGESSPPADRPAESLPSPSSPTASAAECTARLAKAFAAFLAAKYPDLALKSSDDSVEISYHLREWLVYTCGKDGRWSNELSKVQGPDTDGFRITVWFDAPTSAEAWAGRRSGVDISLADLDGLESSRDARLSRIYWVTYGCGARLREHGLSVKVNIDYNTRTSKPTLLELLAIVASTFSDTAR